MQQILTLNQIALEGLERFPRDRYEIGSAISDPDAILVRSEKLTEAHATSRLRCVARAGAGVNNIPVEAMTRAGIVVFNTPGANANSVKESVITAMLLASRDVIGGVRFVDQWAGRGDAAELHRQVEAEKKRFKGGEIAGKTLGVVGLGAIGSMVADVGLRLGMRVIGYDPAISVDAAWRLPSSVGKMENLYALLSRSDFISLHVPVLPDTVGLINEERLKVVKRGAVLINYARDEVVDPKAVAAALDSGSLSRYVSDFPDPDLIGKPGVIFTPHLGASTEEAETNCAIMAAEQIIDFLENGNIRNSVNFPTLLLDRTTGHRIAFSNYNVPRMLNSVLSILADHNLNVVDMLNKSRGEIAYNLIDLDRLPDDNVLAQIEAIEGVVNVRSIEAP
ncbi:MAG: phosphoglycerate dehydrogenase [Gammaproteobacteria bacterium]|nr:phosphoglycerate dehydrogenase [Gammaproteobacteria bacterium]